MYKCFYHSKDLDGRCSGAIVKRKYSDCKMIGIDYGEPFPWDEITTKDQIIMVDYSLEPFKKMIELKKKVKSFLWIDHHKTAMINAEQTNTKELPNNFLSFELAACELTWQYFYPDIEVPLGIKLLGRYDIWDHDYSPGVRPYQFGMKTEDTGVNSFIWSKVFSNDKKHVQEIIKNGRKIIIYQTNKDKWNMRFSFPFEFEGIRFKCINNVSTGSLQFDSVWNSNEYDAVMVFYLKPDKKWSFHIYTEKKDVDLSVIAAKYGGGGHINACGFELDKLPF